MNLLTVTLPGDIHSIAINWAVGRLGHKAEYLFPLDICDGAKWSVLPDSSTLDVVYRNNRQQFRLNDFDVCWMRRVPNTYPMLELTDNNDRSASETEVSQLSMGVIQSLETTAFTVNKLSSTQLAEKKVNQLLLAGLVGFKAPKTIVSNNLDEIRNFFKSVNHKMVYKPLSHFLWSRDDGKKSIALTTEILDLSVFSGVDVQSSPSIYQERIETAFEVRAVIMGKSSFCWSTKPSLGNTFEGVDWRFEGQGKASYDPINLPHDVESKCFALMQKLGIVFGCFDFGVTCTGEYVFFEVNPGGQFLYGDDLGLGLNLLDGFVNFLASKDPYFSYKPNADKITYDEFLLESEAMETANEQIKEYDGDIKKYNYSKI